MTGTVSRMALAVGGLALLAACGTAQASDHSGQQARHSTHKADVTISSDVPADIPQLGYKFAPYTPTSGAKATVSADAAIQAAKDTGIDSDALTQDPAPAAALAMFTDTVTGTRDASGALTPTYQNVPAWVIIGSGAMLYPVGPHGTTAKPVPNGSVCWIINALTGQYIEAGDFAPQS